MRGFYSVQPRGRSALLRPARAAGPDPYSPTSPDYAERHRQTQWSDVGGIVRIDIGEPVKRLPGEGPQTTLSAPAIAPAPNPAGPAPEPAPDAPPTNPARREPPRRRDYGLGRGL